jgi:hypothetical protein
VKVRSNPTHSRPRCAATLSIYFATWHTQSAGASTFAVCPSHRLLKLGGCHDGCHAAQHTDLDALAQARQHDLRTSEIMLTSGGTNARTTCPFLRRRQRRRVDRTSALGLGLLERYVGPATPGHGPSSCRHVFIDKILVHHRTTPNLSWSPGQSKRCCETKTKVV